MSKPQHRTAEYRLAYQAIKRAQAEGQVLWCVEPVCKFRTRHIYPHQRASVSHDTSGTVIIGPSHLHDNLSEAAIRGNKMRARKQPRGMTL